MFIQIDNIRIRVSTIREYKPCRQTVDTKKWYLELKCIGITRLFYFNNEKELNKCIKNLDDIFKVHSVNPF